MPGKVFQGVVTSNKMQKTLVVAVAQQFQERRTGKIVNSLTKYKVHCEDGAVGEGDKVEFVECRPISKDKKYRYLKLITKSAQASAAKVNESV
jgi:small subunit ribosomal protein S17